MKKLLGIVVLGLLWCNVGFAEIINLKCKSASVSYITYIAQIDLNKGTFDANHESDGLPKKHRFSISKVTDSVIIANAIKTEEYSDGARLEQEIIITIDRMIGTINEHYKTIEDTRDLNKSIEDQVAAYGIQLTTLGNMVECESFKTEAKF